MDYFATHVFLIYWQSLYRISNAAINSLFLLSKFIQIFGRLFLNPNDRTFSKMPNNIATAQNILQITDANNYIEFVV